MRPLGFRIRAKRLHHPRMIQGNNRSPYGDSQNGFHATSPPSVPRAVTSSQHDDLIAFCAAQLDLTSTVRICESLALS